MVIPRLNLFSTYLIPPNLVELLAGAKQAMRAYLADHSHFGAYADTGNWCQLRSVEISPGEMVEQIGDRRYADLIQRFGFLWPYSLEKLDFDFRRVGGIGHASNRLPWLLHCAASALSEIRQALQHLRVVIAQLVTLDLF
jgi:hypothetical protein